MEVLPHRRYVDADNSCLFSSIAYLLDKDNFNISSSLIYRLIIVDHIKENNIDEGMLGMSKEEYLQKISESDTWGGAIELKMFSEIFNIQIAVLDVQSGRIDIFGELEDFEKRIYLLYNGIHYDPLVMNYQDNNDSDITIFSPNDSEKLVMFKDFVESIKNKGDYIDSSTINNLKCIKCNNIFDCEEDATKHAINFNHWEFKNI